MLNNINISDNKYNDRINDKIWMACTYKGFKAKLTMGMMMISWITTCIWWIMIIKVLNLASSVAMMCEDPDWHEATRISVTDT